MINYSFIFTVIILSMLPAQNNQTNLLQKIEENSKKINKDQNRVYKQAKALERGGMIDEAVVLYRDVLDKNPSNSSAFRSLKNILKKDQLWDEMIELAKKYSEYSNDPTSRVELMEIYLWASEYKMAYAIADEMVSSSLLNIKGKKKVVSGLLQNRHLDHALKAITSIRKKDDKSFYSLELGAHYSMRMDFINSLDEYLLHLNNKRKNFDLVMSRLMSFPDDAKLKERIKSILVSEKTSTSLEILSNFEFKWGNYENSYKALLDAELEPLIVYQFGKELISVEQFNLAEKVFEDLLKINNQDINIIENSIYQIGSIFEQKTISKELSLPISDRFFNSLFFWSDYLDVDKNSGDAIFRAIAIYDSLSNKFNHSHAKYRLADIKYRAFADLDNALKQFTDLEKSDTQHDIRFASAIKTLDIMIAQGDLENAMKTVEQFMRKYHRKGDALGIRIKKLQISFYMGEFDHVNQEIEKMVQEVSKDHWAYNDILEIYSVILAFNKDMDGLKLFSRAQHKIKQSKKYEAIEILESMFDRENVFVSDFAKYHCAYLYKELNDFPKTVDVIEMTSGETVYSEMSVILYAEIHDYIINDDNEAVSGYLELLDSYPFSIYYEEIRSRLREIVG